MISLGNSETVKSIPHGNLHRRDRSFSGSRVRVRIEVASLLLECREGFCGRVRLRTTAPYSAPRPFPRLGSGSRRGAGVWGDEEGQGPGGTVEICQAFNGMTQPFGCSCWGLLSSPSPHSCGPRALHGSRKGVLCLLRAGLLPENPHHAPHLDWNSHPSGSALSSHAALQTFEENSCCSRSAPPISKTAFPIALLFSTQPAPVCLPEGARADRLL